MLWMRLNDDPSNTLAGAALRIGDEDLVEFRNEPNTLRLMQSGNGLHVLAGTKGPQSSTVLFPNAAHEHRSPLRSTAM